MSEQTNTRVVQRSYAAFGKGDMQTVLSLYDDDVQGDVPGPSQIPIVGTYEGRGGLRNFLAKLSEVQEPLRFEPQDFIAQDDKVVVLGFYRWRVKATGRTYSAKWAHVLTLRDGKIVGFTEYTDTAAMAAAMQS